MINAARKPNNKITGSGYGGHFRGTVGFLYSPDA